AQKDSEDFDTKNARLGRPQSPHLTIYRPQLTTILSLTHRATGMALGGIVTVWGIGGLFTSGHFSENLAAVESMHLSPALLLAVKATLAFPLCYHYINGIRHLAWDMGKFLTIKEVYLTGYSVLAVSVILTAFLASL
ncbi:Succinate dehydrogenase cytochrome b560 subunit, mitochondrial, partial [Zootermopsis nevadensis]